MNIESGCRMVYFGAKGNRIEGRYTQQHEHNRPAVVIFSPDPRYGGSIDNKIVRLLEDSFYKCGFITLAVNYLGVGNSDGVFHGISDGDLTAAVAIDWLQAQVSEISHIWVSGYSFGSLIAANLCMRRPEVENFLLVSPLLEQYDFSFFCPALCDGLVMAGDQDKLINPSHLQKLVSQMNNSNNVSVELINIEGADHKFDACTDKLQQEMINYINMKLATRIAKPVRKKRRRRQKKDTTMLDND